MRNWILSFLLISVCLPGSAGAFVLAAEAAGTAATGRVLASEAIPPYVSAYPGRDPLDLDLLEEPEAVRLESGSSRRAAPSFEALVGAAPVGRGGWQRYLPVFYSLVLPGAGEISLGAYKRGAALVAAEATAWTGYAINRDRGLDSRAAFETFADEHWNHQRFVREHIATAEYAGLTGKDPSLVTFAELDSFGQTPQYQGIWPGYHPYAAKEDEKLNYYENIGKYNWFISGWEDWNRAPPGQPQQMNTALRDQYRSLRRRSNNQLDRADRFVFLSIAARVFSLVETMLMVRNRSEAAGVGVAPEKRYSFTARSTGLASGEIAFEYRFR